MGQLKPFVASRHADRGFAHRRGEVRAFPNSIVRDRHKRLLGRVGWTVSSDRCPISMDIEIVSDGLLPETWILQELEFVVNARGIGIAMGFVSQRLDRRDDPDRFHGRLLLSPVDERLRTFVPAHGSVLLLAGHADFQSFPLLSSRP